MTALPPLPSHPEHGYVWTDAEQRAISAYGEACAAARAESLRLAGLALIGLAEHDQHCEVFDLDDEGRHKACTCGLDGAIATITQAGKSAPSAVSGAEPVAQWQPIETAPKDGTLFLGWISAVRYGETDEGQQYQQDVSQVDFCQWRTQPNMGVGWFEACAGRVGDQEDITHWMPLPAAPGATPPTAEPVAPAACRCAEFRAMAQQVVDADDRQELTQQMIDLLRTALVASEPVAPAAPVEMSPEFTDTARAALLWVLWHHQGGSSPVGQPIRYALGMGAHDSLSEHQVAEAKRWASITGSTTGEFHACSEPVAPAAALAPMTSERHFALREAHCIGASDDYFKVWPTHDNDAGRMLFERGFVRGFDKGAALAASAQPAHASTVIVPRSALEWMQHYKPVLCSKAGLKEVASAQPAAREGFPAVDASLRRAAERTRDDLGPAGTNYPDVRTLLDFAERAIRASNGAAAPEAPK